MAQCGGERRGARRFEDSEEHCCCRCRRRAAQESVARRGALQAATRCYEVHEMMRSALFCRCSARPMRSECRSARRQLISCNVERATSRAQQQRQRQRQRQNQLASYQLAASARATQVVGNAQSPMRALLACTRATAHTRPYNSEARAIEYEHLEALSSE